jgi:hypothetical protein
MFESLSGSLCVAKLRHNIFSPTAFRKFHFSGKLEVEVIFSFLFFIVDIENNFWEGETLRSREPPQDITLPLLTESSF